MKNGRASSSRRRRKPSRNRCLQSAALSTKARSFDKCCDAERAASVEKLSSLIARQQRSFVRDHAEAATRENSVTLLEDIGRSLDAWVEAESIRTRSGTLRRDFRLDDDLLAPIDRYPEFRGCLGG